ncbi:MAG: TerB family tellurite resistance protein [Chryseolinea sp.]
MSEPLLKAILRLFAVVAGDGEVTHQERDQIRRFLDEHLSEKAVDTYLQIFDEYAAATRTTAELHADKKRLEELCDAINADLTQKQKVVIILELVNIVQADGSISETGTRVGINHRCCVQDQSRRDRGHHSFHVGIYA